MEINTIRYVFESNKPDLRRLVVKYGLPPAKNEQDLWKKTNYLVAKFKKEMLKDIAYIHPDRELILWSTSDNNQSNDTKEKETKVVGKNSRADGESEEQSNCNGNPNCNCGSVVKETKSNCNGNPNCNCGSGEVKSNVVSAQPTQPQQPQPQQAPQAQPAQEKVADGSFQETLKNNMPLVIVGSLLLVGGLIFFGNRRMS
jgi:hypothetical protein